MIIKTDSQLGEVTINTSVIAKMAGAAASSCYGVVGMAARNKKDGFVSLLNIESMTKGINVIETEKGVSVEIHVIMEYGVNIKINCKSIINNVRYTLEKDTGVVVDKVTVRVEGIRVDR
ncbi:MAG: Asp23/Gls24 family envelope stress response protein [Oscillospiraceae bacterium]|nr:Asp23/Gls24 family envelope stress response protein [Oscillospiraceae bacterium]